MGFRSICVMLVVAAAVNPAASATRAVANAPDIVIRVRPLVGLCTGLCPNFVVKIHGDGVTIRHFAGSAYRGKRYDFRVAPAASRAMRAELDSLRPEGSLDRGIPCPLDKANEPLRYSVSNFDILWSGAGKPARLRGCKNDDALNHTVARALLDIMVSAVGTRLTAEQARDIRDCVAREEANRPCQPRH